MYVIIFLHKIVYKVSEFDIKTIIIILVALINSQVLLKGCETKGYVIVSAAKAEILQKIHCPVWKDHSLVSKTTWVGTLDSMQYYATVSAGKTDFIDGKVNAKN